MNSYCKNNQDGVQIEVHPEFVPERSLPENNQFFFKYRIAITNTNDHSIQLIHRHWKIKDGNGKSYEVQGPGVVGESPLITSGSTFEYTAFCPLHSSTGNMRGKFQAKDPFNNLFWIDVPVFFFRIN